MSLAGRHVVVTGAGQGIGEAIARLAVRLGARVTVAARTASALDRLASELPEGSVCPVAGDVARPEFADELLEAATSAFGRVHGLVNNAGISRADMIVNLTVQKWREVLDVNLSGSFYVLQAFGRHFVEAHQHDGLPSSIVNISSDAGRRGTIGQINYAAAKSGMLGLTMSAAREWGRFAVRANTVCFGVVETAMTETVRGERFRDHFMRQIPLGRFSTPTEVAPPVCFLLSDGASYISGQHLSVNGGMHIGY